MAKDELHCVDAVVNPTRAQFFKGLAAHLVFSVIWIGGVFSPVIFLSALVLIGGYFGRFLATAIAAASLYPVIFKPGRWTAFTRSIPEWGKYYHKEARLHLESPEEIFPKGDKQPLPAILCYHPHGVLCWSFILNGGFRKEFEPRLGVIAAPLFYAPIFRWFLIEWTGILRPATKESMHELMSSKVQFGMLPGGFEEASISKRGTDRVYVKSRKGFIKYALQHGYALVPVYCFGECDTYHSLQGFWKLRLWLNKQKLPGVASCGVWWFPLLPLRSKLNTGARTERHMSLDDLTLRG